MKKEYPYRFKTEKEFIKEYGSEWRKSKRYSTRTGFYWNTEMDIFLGTVYPFTDEEIKKFMRPIDNFFSFPKCDEWSISDDMLTPNAPTYKPKKFVREI